MRWWSSSETRPVPHVGARIPKGILLVGPPGTGKTLMARAVAGEAGVAFISVTGSHFMEMFVGVGAARVRGLFEAAREHAPSIIFVDEIDSIGRKRGTGTVGGHDERDQTLNQLLAEMDGFETTEGIVVMAATQPSRHPRSRAAARRSLRPAGGHPAADTCKSASPSWSVHAKDKQLDPDVDFDARRPGHPRHERCRPREPRQRGGAHRRACGRTEIHAAHFDPARDRVLMGLQRTSMVLTDEERRSVAHHEAGHAVMAACWPMPTRCTR